MRIKMFKATLPAHCFDLDEDGIPAIAHWNTEGDTPIAALQSPKWFAWIVWYLPDGGEKE